MAHLLQIQGVVILRGSRGNNSPEHLSDAHNSAPSLDLNS